MNLSNSNSMSQLIKTKNIVAAFRGMHVLPAKHSYMRDYPESVTTGQTDGQTDDGQSDPYVLLCFAGNTKIKGCL